MTGIPIALEAVWGEENKALATVRATITRLYSASSPTKSCAFPPSVASHPAFTVKLDTKRLDLGFAAARDRHRRLMA